MRYLLMLTIVTIAWIPCQAQGYLPGSYIGMPIGGMQRTFTIDSLKTKKWSLNKYGGISTGFVAFKGGSASYFSAPVGVQLNRKISKNVYAFAGISVAPAYTNFNQAFLHANNNNQSFHGNSFMYQPNGISMYSRAELGLMYTNDEHTFQISGSIGVERRQFPQLQDFQNFTKPKNSPALK